MLALILSNICDPLSKNLTCLHFHSLTYCCLERKTNELQLYLVSAFGVIAIDKKKSKTINLYSAYMEQITGACLIHHMSQVQRVTELELVSFYLP